MSADPDYAPSPIDWVRAQVEQYEQSGGTDALTLRDTGYPVVVMTMRGVRTGKTRKVPVMRVESNGEYVAVGSRGGAPTDPVWVQNLRAASTITLQDGPVVRDLSVRELDGDERAAWWDRAVAAFPNYADYQTRTDRLIPVFLLTAEDQAPS
jgi:deazaflavin-dependent oxidoreductase (nitroreductase family)